MCSVAANRLSPHPSPADKGRRTEQTDDEVEIREVDHFVQDIVRLALEQGLVYTPCPDCGGPRFHKKKGQGMTCFRCRRYWPYTVWPKKYYCDLCKQQLTGNRHERCEPCADKSLRKSRQKTRGR